MKKKKNTKQRKKNWVDIFLGPYNGIIYTVFPDEVQTKEQFDICAEIYQGIDMRIMLIMFMYGAKNTFEATNTELQKGQEYLLRVGVNDKGNAIIQFRSIIGEDTFLDDIYIDKKTLQSWGVSGKVCDEVFQALALDMMKRYHTIHVNSHMFDDEKRGA